MASPWPHRKSAQCGAGTRTSAFQRGSRRARSACILWRDGAPMPPPAFTHLPDPSFLPPVPHFGARAGVPTAGPITAAEADSGQERRREPVVTTDLLCARKGW